MNRRSVLIGGAAALFHVAGCERRSAGTSEPIVGVSLLNLSSEFIVMLNRAMDARARDIGLRLIVNDAQRSAERQVQQAESFVAQRVGAIILNPCEVEASSPAVEKALAAGIPIVNVNSETRTPPSAFVGSNDEESGRMAMEYIVTRLNGQGNVVMMHGYMGQAAQLQRDAGAKAVLTKNPGMKLLAEQTAEWDRAKAMSLMENWIQSFGAKIDAVFAHNDEMAMGAVVALEQAKAKDRTVVAGVDAIADALQAVKDGRLDATVYQDAQGQGRTAVDVAAKLIRKQEVAKKTLIPFRMVTRDNVSGYLKS